ncbi:MAG: helix-turn-helix domain-containing protein [Pseudonocardiaceae bacterium]
MPTSQGPLLARRRLGVELRNLREEAKLRLDDVATQLMISSSKLSRLENGQSIPQQRDVRDLINFYQVAGTPLAERLVRWTREGRRQGWWMDDTTSHVVGEPLDTYLALESGASVMRSFEPAVLPGLLQTADYARALLRELQPRHTDTELDPLVKIRLRRKELLLRTEEPSRLLAVVDECTLRRVVGSKDIMRHQLEALIKFSQRPNVTLQVFPFDAGAHEAMTAKFTVFQFADDLDRDVVHLESHLGDRYLEQESYVLRYLRIFDSVSHRSLEPAASREFIHQTIQVYFTTKDGEREA